MAEKHNSYYGEKIERHIILDAEDESCYNEFQKIGKAFSSTVRIKILKILKYKSMNIVEISETLGIPISSTAFHIRCLEDAGLIVTVSQPGIRGSQRVCSASTEDIYVSLNVQKEAPDHKAFTVDMPIGHFFDCDIRSTCGLADTTGYIEECDNPKAFYSPNRCNAQLIWFQQGYIEYRFPNHFLAGNNPASIAFSLEICSEAPGYRNVWPSDLSFSINNKEIVTYTSPGDFGGRHGKLTPAWWTDGNTQYGLLKTISVNRDGSSLDEAPSGTVCIHDLDLVSAPYISFKIEIKSDARFIGGINLFGEKFGDYAQNIVMRIDC